MDRQHWRVGLARDPHEALRPALVADAVGANAADFAGRKNDQRFVPGQTAIGLAQLCAQLAAEYVARNQQRRQAIELQQIIVGQDAHIATDPADQLQQAQRIDRAKRMVGDYHDPAFGRNVRDVCLLHPVLRAEAEQAMLDKIEAGAAVQAAYGVVDLLLANHPPQQIHDRLAKRAAATVREPGEFLEKTLLDTDHARIRIARMSGA